MIEFVKWKVNTFHIVCVCFVRKSRDRNRASAGLCAVRQYLMSTNFLRSSSHSPGYAPIAQASVIPAGCRPASATSTRSGASRVMRSTRLT